MNSQDTNKTSEELQREVHGQINKIGSNIDAAKRRLTPGSLLDDAIFYPQGQSLQGTYSHLKNNPMGTMFLSLGTLLLMEDQQRVTYEAHFKRSASDAASRGKVKYSDARDAVSEKTRELSEKTRELSGKAKLTADGAKSKFSGKKEELSRKASDKARELKDQARSKKDELQHKVQSKKNEFSSDQKGLESDLRAGARDLEGDFRSRKAQASQKADEIRQRGAQKVDSAKESIIEGYDRARAKISEASPIGQAMHPYAIASMGLGLGATLGASIPSESLERRMNDPKAQEKLSKLNKDFDNAIREAGNRIKNHLIDEIKGFDFH